MGAVLHPFRGGLCTTLALDAGVIPKIEGELLTTATDILERRVINYRGQARSGTTDPTDHPGNASTFNGSVCRPFISHGASATKGASRR